METITEKINYKNAYKCNKCPGRNDSQGCPMWWEYIQTDIESGKERLVKQCGNRAMQSFLIESIKASNRPAAEMGAMRDEVVSAVGKIADAGIRRLSNES